VARRELLAALPTSIVLRRALKYPDRITYGTDYQLGNADEEKAWAWLVAGSKWNDSCSLRPVR